jgi:hypothetical protein
MAGKKISQLPSVSTALASGILAIVQGGKTWYITFTNLLKNYYTKTEVNALLDNIVGGGATTTTKIMEELVLPANTATTYIHDLGTEDFDYAFLEYSTNYSKYVKPQFAVAEVTRTDTTLTLVSLEAIDDFKLMFKTFV